MATSQGLANQLVSQCLVQIPGNGEFTEGETYPRFILYICEWCKLGSWKVSACGTTYTKPKAAAALPGSQESLGLAAKQSLLGWAPCSLPVPSAVEIRGAAMADGKNQHRNFWANLASGGVWQPPPATELAQLSLIKHFSSN